MDWVVCACFDALARVMLFWENLFRALAARGRRKFNLVQGEEPT